jgi:hypothetical protein
VLLSLSSQLLYLGKKELSASAIPGKPGVFGNVQNEQFPRRHFYVPFGEFVHLHIKKTSAAIF